MKSQAGATDGAGPTTADRRAALDPAASATQGAGNLDADTCLALFRAHPDGMYWLEPLFAEGRIVDFRLAAVNPAGALLLRRTEGQVAGQRLSQLLHGGEGSQWLEHGRTVWETGAVQEFREPMESPGGLLPMRWFALNVQRVGAALLVLAREETALCRAQSELARMEARLRQLERIAHLGSYAYDLRRGRAWWSDEAYRIAGLEPGAAEPSYETGLALVHPEDRERIHQAVTEAKRRGGPYSNEYRIVRPDGSVRIVHSNGQVLLDEQGQAVEFVATLQDVTELRASEERAHASEARFRRVIDNVPVILFELDAQGTVLFSEGKGLERQGIGAQDVVGHSIFTLYADRPAFLDSIRRALAGEALVAAHETRGGVYERWLEPIFDPQGQVAGVVGVSLDVTERHRAESELRANRALLRTVMDGLPEFIWAKDLEGRYLIANRAMGEAHGMDPERMVGRHIRDLPGVPEQVRQEHEALDHAVIDEGRVVDNSDFRLTDAQGRQRRFRVQKRPLLNAERGVIGVVGIAHDITEQQRIQQELEQHRALLQAIFDTFPARLMVTGTDGRAVLVNRAFSDELGLTPREALLRGVGCPPLKAEDDRRRQEELERVLRDGRSFDSERQRRRPDGSELHERVIRVPLFDRTGSIDGALNIALDITAQKAAEAQLRQAQKMEAFGQLAGGVAHDFNNLLQVILGHGEIARLRVGDDPKLTRALEQMMGAASRGGELTRKLLAFGRRQVLRPRNLQLDALVEDMLRLLERLLGRHIALRQEHRAQGVCVHADPGMVEQVVMNLCVNARDAMPGGGTLTLRTGRATVDEAQRKALDLPRAGSYVRLSVADTGTGMPAEVLQHIFEPFFTTKPEGQGTGLGLSTVYGIVRQHGGAIQVDSTPGAGTTFTVLLPGCEEGTPLPAAQGPSFIPRGSETLLVVEEETQVLGLLEDLLQSQGYRVLAARGVQEALRLHEAHRDEIALVLVDVMMPRSGVWNLLRQVRMAAPQVGVLLSTGYLADAVDARFRGEYRLDIIEKPYSPYDLFRRVRGLLDRAGAPGPTPRVEP
jgi:PAS domain S-box-containing protein